MAPPTSEPHHIGHQYGVRRRLGKALYGSVYLCHDHKSNDSRAVAIKEVNLRTAKRRLHANPHMDNPWQERKIAQQLTAIGPHQHILTFRDNFTHDGAWYIVMDYCNGGDLLGVLQDQIDGRMDEATALRYFYQVARGVAHLHAHNIAHRDLSLENVLLHDGVCKLSDFGLSTDGDRVCTERVGKAYYMAPEVVSSDRGYDAKAADMWSLGILLFILLTGSPLVQSASPKDKGLRALDSCGVEKILSMWGMSGDVSPESMDVLSSLLCVNPLKRPSVDELMEHPALERGVHQL